MIYDIKTTLPEYIIRLFMSSSWEDVVVGVELAKAYPNEFINWAYSKGETHGWGDKTGHVVLNICISEYYVFKIGYNTYYYIAGSSLYGSIGLLTKHVIDSMFVNLKYIEL